MCGREGEGGGDPTMEGVVVMVVLVNEWKLLFGDCKCATEEQINCCATSAGTEVKHLEKNFHESVIGNEPVRTFLLAEGRETEFGL